MHLPTILTFEIFNKRFNVGLMMLKIRCTSIIFRKHGPIIAHFFPPCASVLLPVFNFLLHADHRYETRVVMFMRTLFNIQLHLP